MENKFRNATYKQTGLAGARFSGLLTCYSPPLHSWLVGRGFEVS